MTLRYYLGLYGAYFRLGLKTMAQYRADVWIMAVSTAIRDGATLLFLSVIFGKITQLQGWSFYGIVLIYGLGTASEDGQNFVFNDAGQFVFDAHFNDGTSAVLIAEVPEPALGAMVAVVAGLASLRRARRVPFRASLKTSSTDPAQN